MLVGFQRHRLEADGVEIQPSASQTNHHILAHNRAYAAMPCSGEQPLVDNSAAPSYNLGIRMDSSSIRRKEHN
jgi:hypothetical protein